MERAVTPDKNMSERKCKACGTLTPGKEFDSNDSVCPNCGFYMSFHAWKCIKALADPDSFVKWDADEPFSNPMGDSEYYEKLTA